MLHFAHKKIKLKIQNTNCVKNVIALPSTRPAIPWKVTLITSKNDGREDLRWFSGWG